MAEDHYRLKRLEMALFVTSFLLKRTRICHEYMPKTTRLATLNMSVRAGETKRRGGQVAWGEMQQTTILGDAI